MKYGSYVEYVLLHGMQESITVALIVRHININNMQVNKEGEPIFYLHTPPKYNWGGVCIGERASIAAKVHEGTIVYGFAICSRDDNFSRKVGREKAIQRMEEAYGVVDIHNGYFDQFKTDEDRLLVFTTTLGHSIRKNFNKYKRKLESYKKTQASKQRQNDSTSNKEQHNNPAILT